ncbi:putative deoxyribonuclease RhsC [Acinetobacter venetianus]|nr:putative deoxyribonuclease RhsC [Acinetobacter venetianus]
MISIRIIAISIFTLLILLIQSAYASPDVVAQNYAATRSSSIQSCTIGYDVFSGDIKYNQQLIMGKLPYSINYNAPLRLNISSAQEFAQPENSTLGWSDNYQSSVMIQRISTSTTQYTKSRFYYKTASSQYYTYETSDPVTKRVNAKIIFVRLPGEQTSQIFKEENGKFQRLYSADPIKEFNTTAIQLLNWDSSLGEYKLSWSGDNLIVEKYGVKYLISSNYHVIAPSATHNDTIFKYLDSNLQEQQTRSYWSTSNATRTNTALYLQSSVTSSIDLHRVELVEAKGRSLKMQYDSRMNLIQVSDQYNNKLKLERNFHEGSSGTSQTIDESRLVTKVSYTYANQDNSQVAEFKYKSYEVSTPSTGVKGKVYALTESNSTTSGKLSFINELTELGAMKAFVASKGRTADNTYFYPILSQVQNSADKVIRQWNVTQNYVLGTDGSYSIAQTTLRSHTPMDSASAYDYTSIYNDIDRTITTSIVLGSTTSTNTVKSELLDNSVLKTNVSGYPCLTFGDKPINSAEFSVNRSQLLNITDGNGSVTAMGYDDKNRLSGIYEAKGTSTGRYISYGYVDADGNYDSYKFRIPTQIAIVKPDFSEYKIITNTVDVNGNITSQTETSSQSGSTSKITTFEYISDPTNLNNNLLASVDGPRTGTADKITYTYDAFGNLASQSQTVNGAARTTQYLGYNTFGGPERTVNPTGLVNQFVYNADGTLKSQTTGVGGATGAITGQTTSFTYNALKQKISESSPDGEVTQFAYDLAGRLTQITLPNGNKVQKNYYSIGVLASEKNLTSAGVVASESYQYLDSKGFVSKIQQGNVPSRQFTTFSYDNNGNLTQTTSAAGIIEKWSYDALNRVVSHTDGEGNVDTTAYDVNDNVTIAKDALNAGTNPFSYRNGKTLTQEVNSDYGTKTYSYNEADQLTQRLHGARKCNFNNLDELGRYRAFECALNSGTTSNESLVKDNYTYDQSRYGRLDKVSTGVTGYDVDTSYTYDAYDRITQKGTVNQLFNRYAVKTGQSLNVNYGYSIGGKPTALTLPSSRSITYVYNAQGMLSSINLYGAPLIRNISYDGANRVTGWQWGAAGNASYIQTYNNDSTINTITNKDNSNVINYSLGYAYDNDGRITQLTRNNGTKDNYGYDNVDRLTSESRTTGTTSTYSIAYTYDKNGNRTSFTATGRHMQPAASATYTYTGNKLTGYSKAGVGQTLGHTGNAELSYGPYAPAYDMGGRRKVDRSTADYYYMNYNHKNERSFRDKVVNGALATMTQFIYDEQSHLIGEYDKNGVLVEYVWLGDKPIAAIYGVGNTAQIYYIVSDAQNTPRRLVSSANHAVVWAWDSTAFGLGDPVGNVTFNLRFPGQYYDAGTNQFYNHNRYYNPELGRYMEPDPIGLEGGLNPYAYAGNDPINKIDATGLNATTAFGGLLFETYNWTMGNGFDWQNVKGAFYDGYNGQGSFNSPIANIGWSVGDDLLNFGTFGYGSVIKNTVQTGVRQLDNVIQMTKFVQPELKAFTHEFKYADRVRARAVQDPVSHNFPYSFDDLILSSKPLPQKNGYNIYQFPGSMTGKVVTNPITGIRTQTYKDGVFEIGKTKDGIIDHRFFRPRN